MPLDPGVGRERPGTADHEVDAGRPQQGDDVAVERDRGGVQIGGG